MLAKAPLYFDMLKKGEIPGLTHNSIVAALPEISLALGLRMGDRQYRDLLQLPISGELRTALEMTYDDQLLSQERSNKDVTLHPKPLNP